MYCSVCGKQLPDGSGFCMHCGAKVPTSPGSTSGSPVLQPQGGDIADKAGGFPFLEKSAVGYWRDVLGGLPSWSPFFSPPPKDVELLLQLDPPWDEGKEQFIFRVPTTGRNMFPPPPALSVAWATVRGRKMKSNASFVLATDSRLIAYGFAEENYPKIRLAMSLLYKEIVSLEVRGDHFILHLTDGGEADLQMRIPRPGVLAAMAVIGAPSGMEKGTILNRERERVNDAQSFGRVFSRFFAEIADRNRS